jgi:hypothetical protein
MTANIVRFDAVRTVAIASITSSYTQFGSVFAHPMRVLHFINDSNGTYMLSFDGTTDNFPLVGDSFNLYDLTSNQDADESFRCEKNSQLWIKYVIAPTSTAGTQTDTVYAVAVYGRGE